MLRFIEKRRLWLMIIGAVLFFYVGTAVDGKEWLGLIGVLLFIMGVVGSITGFFRTGWRRTLGKEDDD